MAPVTRYARNGEVHLAYQVVGEGEPLVLVSSIGHLEMVWEHPVTAQPLRRLSSFARLVTFDRRGMGVSDRLPIPDYDEQARDLGAVMDAAGVEAAALMGLSEACATAVKFAAAHPHRVTSLVLSAPAPEARYIGEDAMTLAPRIEAEWSDGIGIELWVPSLAGDPAFRDWWARFGRHAMSPGVALQMISRAAEIDLSADLPRVQAPTLVIHRTDDRVASVEGGRAAAAAIPGARFVELPGADHGLGAGSDEVVDLVQEFLTGSAGHGAATSRLLTILFVDVADSTSRAHALGDRAWSELVAHYHRVVRGVLANHGGTEVDDAGDGFMATFESPTRAIRCAIAIRDAVAQLGLELRAGIHTGECAVSGGKVRGVAVHTAARVLAAARPGQVCVTAAVRDLVAGSGLDFERAGVHRFKGLQGEWRLFAAGG